MSEYQFYEFRTIDRPFTAEEKTSINQLSSRGKADNHKIRLNYSYSNFRGNPEELMFQYFDAMIYWANFGCKRLMFRFPLALINKKELIPYTFSDNIEIKTKGNFVLLKIEENVEDGGYFDEWLEDDNTMLSDLMGIRQQIINGDYRALYLAWLYFHSHDSKATFPDDYYEDDDEADSEEYDEEENAAKMKAVEPPVPPNMKELDADLAYFVEFWGLSEDWVEAAAVGSGDIEEDKFNIEELLAKLSEEEKNDFLVRLAHQEVNLSVVFLQRLKQFLPKKATKSGKRRTVKEIAFLASEIRANRLEEERKENERKALAKLAKTYKDQNHLWKETAYLLSLRTAKGYDDATKNLEDLYDAARHYNDLANYQLKLHETIDGYKNSTAFMKRIKHLPYV